MKMQTLCFILVLCSLNSIAQSPAMDWQKCLGGTGNEWARNSEQTADGGYIFIGTTNSNNGDVFGNHNSGDIWVVKLNSTGTLQWQKCLGGALTDWGISIQQTLDYGFILVGNTLSFDGDIFGNHDSSNNYNDIWVAKLDSIGTIQWSKCLGGKYDEKASSIKQTTNGGYILTGTTTSNDGDVLGYHDSIDIWVVKLDSLGIIQWQKCLGGDKKDEAGEIKQSMDGGYIIVGGTMSNNGDVVGLHSSLLSNSHDVWVVKLDSIGTIQWQKCLGGSGDDFGTSILQSIDKGYIIAAQTGSNDFNVSGNHGNLDFWFLKIDSTGLLQWQKCFGSTGGESASSFHPTSDGGFIVGGVTTGPDNGDVIGSHGYDDFWVVKLDSVINIEWTKSLGGSSSESVSSVIQSSDGGYFLSGYSTSNDGDVSGSHGNFEVWVVKLSASPLILNYQNKKPLIYIYPNPSENQINIKLDDKLIGSNYTLYNAFGNITTKGKMISGNMSIDLTNYPAGEYFLGIEFFPNYSFKILKR